MLSVLFSVQYLWWISPLNVIVAAWKPDFAEAFLKTCNGSCRVCNSLCHGDASHLLSASFSNSAAVFFKRRLTFAFHRGENSLATASGICFARRSSAVSFVGKCERRLPSTRLQSSHPKTRKWVCWNLQESCVDWTKLRGREEFRAIDWICVTRSWRCVVNVCYLLLYFCFAFRDQGYI